MEAEVKVKNLSTFYSDKGSGEGILILHGWGASLNSWKKVQDALVEKGFRVVVLDLPGFGRSEDLIEKWNLDDYAEYVCEFSKKVNLDKFTVLGHSFGGVLAAKLAVTNKERVKKLILVSTLGATKKRPFLVKVFLFITKIKDVLWPLPGYTFVESAKKKIRKALKGGRVAPKGSPLMKNNMANILKNSRLPLFEKVTVPTLILWGEKDVTSPISEAFLIHKKIPSSYIYVFKNLPHALNLKASQELAQQIGIFLKDTTGYPGTQNIKDFELKH